MSAWLPGWLWRLHRTTDPDNSTHSENQDEGFRRFRRREDDPHRVDAGRILLRTLQTEQEEFRKQKRYGCLSGLRICWRLWLFFKNGIYLPCTRTLSLSHSQSRFHTLTSQEYAPHTGTPWSSKLYLWPLWSVWCIFALCVGFFNGYIRPMLLLPGTWSLVRHGTVEQSLL